jgi:succinate dehydrogenase/fumarate reductase-like Fe-S protein
MKLILHIWRQRTRRRKGRMVRYEVPDVNPRHVVPGMLDVLNET